ncbi:MAG: endonuclease/exonuclease/phosphatase family protein [Vicinamibacterales bacterium]
MTDAPAPPPRPARSPATRRRDAGRAELRVAQLNAGSLFEPGWHERRAEIIAWLDELRADVVCLEEIWSDAHHPPTARWIAERTAIDYHLAFGGLALAEGLWKEPTLRFGAAVLSRWPIELHQVWRLPVDPDDAPEDRFLHGFPNVLLHARTAGLDVFATHLTGAPHHGRHRCQQVLALDRLVRTVRGGRDGAVPFGQRQPHPPALLCGDFNAEPDSDEIRFLCGLTSLVETTTFWQDAWRVAGEGPGLTQDWRSHPLAARLNVHRKRIDYVFVGSPFLRMGDAGRVLRAEPAFHEPRTGVQASDHSGLVVDLAWPQRPPD